MNEASKQIVKTPTLTERLRAGWVTHHQVNREWEPYATVAKQHAPPKIQVEAAEEIERLQALYHELLFAVGNKCPNESRHETALRYIHEAEQRSELRGQDGSSVTDGDARNAEGTPASSGPDGKE